MSKTTSPTRVSEDNVGHGRRRHGRTVHLHQRDGQGAESKNDRLNVAAIGVGGRGFDVGHQAAALGNMVAVADVHLGNARKFADCFGGKCQVYQDYRKLLDRQDIEAVTIATPDHWHVKIAIDAMHAGKDVYCEKPLTLTIDEGKLICKAVEADRPRVADRHAAAERVRQRLFGGRGHRPQRPTGNKLDGPGLDRQWPRRADRSRTPIRRRNWTGISGWAPPRRSPSALAHRAADFRWWFDYSGGHVTDWGVHHIDIALWALGGDDTGPSEVEGRGGSRWDAR